jgi:hypothetical protein
MKLLPRHTPLTILAAMTPSPRSPRTMLNPGRSGSIRRRVTALAVACFLAMPLGACRGGPAPQSDYYGDVDYHWLPPVTNFVKARLQNDLRRVPPLLQRGCQLPPPNQVEELGEEYTLHISAEAALLRFVETDPIAATMAVPGARPPLNGPNGRPLPQMLDPDRRYADCLDQLAPGWRHGTPDTRRGWADVVNLVEAIPPFHGTPGTDGIPGCRGTDADDGNWDVQMAWLMRVWGIMLGDRDAVLPKPIGQLGADFAVRIWLQGGVADEDHSVCYGPETENHEFLIRATRYLHNVLLPIVPGAASPDNGAVEQYDVNDNKDNSTNGVRAYLDGQLRDWMDHDFVEYNARPYGRYQMLGLLNLYDFAPALEQKVRSEAEGPLDLLSAKHTAESMDRLRIAPFRRRLEDYSEDLVVGDTVAPMYAVWVGGLSLPQYVGGGAAGEMSLAASSDYRPPDILIDRMLNRGHRDFFEQFNGQGQGEAGYAGPDFTITGGGRVTDCPYGFQCVGSANDPGAVVPIALIPHRSPVSVQTTPPEDAKGDDPSAESVLDIGRTAGDTCLYRNFACGAAVNVHDYAPLMPACADAGTDVPYRALRFDGTCLGPAYAGDCFFVYESQVDQSASPLSYFVTHSCDPAWPDSTVQYAFSAFERYMRTTGAPAYLDDPATPEMTIRLPEETSLAPGDLVAVRIGLAEACDGCGGPEFLTYSIASPTPLPDQPFTGDLVTFSPMSGGRARVVFHDPGAAETMYSYDDGVDPLMVAPNFDFSWSAELSRNGLSHITVTTADQPAEVRHVTVDVMDVAPIPGCTLANGLTGCPTGPCLPGVCSNPPPTQQKARVYDHVFDYGQVPLAHGRPLDIEGTSTHITVGDPYIVTACVAWYAYFTPEGDRTPGADPDSPEQCETIRIEASEIKANPFGPLLPSPNVPIHLP